MDDSPTVVCAGLVTLDVVQTVDALPTSNQKMVARDLFVDYGGPAANAAGVAVGLGASASLVSALGESPIAAAVRGYLGEAGVRLVDCAPGQPTVPVSSVLVESDTGLRAVASTNATRSTVTESIPDSVLARASACLVDGHNLELCIEMAKRARDRGIPVVFDGGSWKPGTERLLPMVSHALVSADFRPPGVTDVLGFLAGHGCVLAGQSRGGEPTRLLIEGERTEVAVQRVEVCDTVGAGDALHGALAYAVARIGWDVGSLAEAVSFATAIASISCRARGARGWLQSELATEARRRVFDFERR